jgi:hypothetical protein
MNASVVTVKSSRSASAAPWLLLIHQIPPKPDYFRVKVRRRLERIGAVPLKNSVYVLPHTEQCLEDFRWLLGEIVSEGGEATLCEAGLVEGFTGPELEEVFRSARDPDYAEITTAAEQLVSVTAKAEEVPPEMEAELARLRRRLEEVQAIDYFGSAGGATAARALARLEVRLNRPQALSGKAIDRMRGKVWVTRRDVFVDRIASAWLIRRFIDARAEFRFVAGKTYRPAKGEVRFDMYEAEYTHEADRCTFEIILLRAGLRDRALRAVGEIVHDIDCKDGKFEREEASGVAAMLRGLVRTYSDDATRLERGGALFDQLYASLR